jgi:hypothetical protein
MASTLAIPAIRISPPERQTGTHYNLPMGYLRAFITVLVLAFHAVLPYGTSAPPAPRSLVDQPRWWMAFPGSDPHRWTGFDLFALFNDIFFMSLMFFLSGLFVWNSLARKGSRIFVRDRAVRLGIPFLLAAAIIAPLAYYPTYLQTASHAGVTGYFRQWLSLHEWPAGPAWFVWVLLVFGCLAAGLSSFKPTWGDVLRRFASHASQRPARFFAVLLLISTAGYIPMALAFNPVRWSHFGPFYFQTSRILHYAIYFFAGVNAGAFGLDRGLLATTGKLARRWSLWSATALAAFLLALLLTLAALANYQHAPYIWTAIGGCGFVLSCAASNFAFLSLFVRFVRTRRTVFDSLRDNAYGIYLIHYAFASWVQYALLRTMLPGFAKGFLAFFAVLALSWFTTAALRRLPAVRRVI